MAQKTNRARGLRESKAADCRHKTSNRGTRKPGVEKIIPFFRGRDGAGRLFVPCLPPARVAAFMKERIARRVLPYFPGMKPADIRLEASGFCFNGFIDVRVLVFPRNIIDPSWAMHSRCGLEPECLPPEVSRLVPEARELLGMLWETWEEFNFVRTLPGKNLLGFRAFWGKVFFDGELERLHLSYYRDWCVEEGPPEDLVVL